jgi:hypothetical protein
MSLTNRGLLSLMSVNTWQKHKMFGLIKQQRSVVLRSRNLFRPGGRPLEKPKVLITNIYRFFTWIAPEEFGETLD